MLGIVLPFIRGDGIQGTQGGVRRRTFVGGPLRRGTATMAGIRRLYLVRLLGLVWWLRLVGDGGNGWL
jgi:hypothetical protein